MTRITRYRTFYILGDLTALLLSLSLFNIVRYYLEPIPTDWWSTVWGFLFDTHNVCVNSSVVLFFMSLFALSGYYNKPLNKSRMDEFWVTLWSVSVGSVISFLFWVLNDEILNPKSHINFFFILLGLLFLAVYAMRLPITLWAIHHRNIPDYWMRVLLVGTAEGIARIEAAQKRMRIIILDRIVLEEPSQGDSQQLSDVVHRAWQKHNPEAIYLSTSTDWQNVIGHLLYRLYALRCPIYIDVDSFSSSQPRPRLSNSLIWGVPIVEVTETNMDEFEKNVKWCFDRFFSLFLLVLLSPLLLSLAIIVKRGSHGSIIFRQERIGRYGHPFYIYKFRTMHTDAENKGPSLSYDGDPRITSCGRWMRRYRLDELPQLYNVLRGDMSFVGPRPERQYYINQLVQYAPYYYLLHNVLPGITSWGMVRYGYASTIEEMVERSRFDWLYYENMSLKLDITIMLYTIGTVINAKGK